jgi:hypothetical protein
VLGDEYISQHVLQAYREHLEQQSYKIYMSSRARDIVSILSGTQLETSWGDIITELDESVADAKPQTESESEIRNRILEKINGREGDADGIVQPGGQNWP